MANELNPYIDYTELYSCGMEILQEYKDMLTKVDAVAEGKLQGTADYQFDIKENTITLNFLLENYWSIVEDGRTPNTKNTKPSFYPKIKRWVALKGIDPKYAGAIWQTIRLYGDKAYREKGGRKPLEKALQKAEKDGLIDKLGYVVSKAFGTEIEIELEDIDDKKGIGRH